MVKCLFYDANYKHSHRQSKHKDKMFLPLGIPVVMTIKRVFSRKDILLKHKRRSCKKEVLNREMSI